MHIIKGDRGVTSTYTVNNPGREGKTDYSMSYQTDVKTWTKLVATVHWRGEEQNLYRPRQ
jgi:hypothetical protein